MSVSVKSVIVSIRMVVNAAVIKSVSVNVSTGVLMLA